MPEIFTEFHITAASVIAVLVVFNIVALIVCSAAPNKHGAFTRIAIVVDVAELLTCLSAVVMLCLAAFGGGEVLVTGDFCLLIGGERVAVPVISPLLDVIARYTIFSGLAAALTVTAILLPVLIAVTNKRATRDGKKAEELSVRATGDAACEKEENAAPDACDENKQNERATAACGKVSAEKEKRTVVLGGKTIIMSDAVSVYERYLNETHR